MVLKNFSVYLPNETTRITDFLLKTREELKDSELSKIVLLSKELDRNGNPFTWDLLKGSKNGHPEYHLQDLKKYQKNYIALALTPVDLEIETSRHPWFVNRDNELITTPVTGIMPINNTTSKKLKHHALVSKNYLQRIISKYEL